jgi:small GTP-binding protein
MTQPNQNFQAAAVGAKFENICVKFDNLLAQGNLEELTAIRKKLKEELKAHREQGILTVAFVGQYSAGKSTLISALTGRRDIRIDSDIATDKTASYDWNGIKLIDTPGLFTDRQDHDQITYEEITKSDLLVFCLTSMLFDSLTVENFQKLAYEKGYRWKMMLVINKMSEEAGEEEQKIASYRNSLTTALESHRLDEFPLCFIDAKDYCDGVDEEDEFLIEISRFQTFIEALNTFVQSRGSLARFDTPVRIALSYLDEAQLSFIRDSNKDSAFFELLNRLSRKVHQERDRLRTKVQGIGLRLSAEVANEGTKLAGKVGKADKKEMEDSAKQIEHNLRKHCEKAEAETKEVIERAIESIQEEIKDVLEGDLAQAFIRRLEVNQKVSARNVDSNMDVDRLKKQVEQLKKIGEIAGEGLTKLATRKALNTTGQGLLRSSNVAGSALHQSVYAVGKLLNFKFAPWQAVNIAKGIGNVAKVVGPVFSGILVGLDIYAVKQESDQDKKLSDARCEITSQFQAIAKDLESQVESQLRKVEAEVYGDIEKRIAAARQNEEEAIASSNTSVKQLAEIRKDFELILSDITKATEAPAA